jgi:ABC-2 type transport system permease protein
MLQPVTGRSWWRGLANLMAHELHMWWGTRRWLVQLLIWILLINGSVALLGGLGRSSSIAGDAANPADAAQIKPDAIYQGVMEMFFQVATACTAFGAVISIQGTIIQEKQMGTAAWILSKPASRPAFILAKLAAHTLGLLVLAMVVPTIVLYAEVYLFAGVWPVLPSMLAALSVWLLLVLFYLALTTMLGTFLNSRGAVLGIALGFWFASGLVPLVLPALAAILPGTLSGVALLLALGPRAPQALPPTAIIPVIATILWIVIFTALAIWRFGREEF